MSPPWTQRWDESFPSDRIIDMESWFAGARLAIKRGDCDALSECLDEYLRVSEAIAGWMPERRLRELRGLCDSAPEGCSARNLHAILDAVPTYDDDPLAALDDATIDGLADYYAVARRCMQDAPIRRLQEHLGHWDPDRAFSTLGEIADMSLQRASHAQYDRLAAAVERGDRAAAEACIERYVKLDVAGLVPQRMLLELMRRTRVMSDEAKRLEMTAFLDDVYENRSYDDDPAGPDPYIVYPSEPTGGGAGSSMWWGEPVDSSEGYETD